MPDPNEVPGFTPLSADTAANAPAPQPWQKRQRLFAESALALQDASFDNPLQQRIFTEAQFLGSAYAPDIETISGNDDWLNRVAKSNLRLGKKTDGIELSFGDVEQVAVATAKQLVELRRNNNIDNFFKQKPEQAKYLFELLFTRSIIAKNAAAQAGLFVDGVARSMSIGLDSKYLQPQDQLGITVDSLAFESLNSEQKAAMPYALVTIQSLDSLINDRLLAEGNSLANMAEYSKGHIETLIKDPKGFNSAGLTGLSSDVVDLPYRIRTNPNIRLQIVDDPIFASETRLVDGPPISQLESTPPSEISLTTQAREHQMRTAEVVTRFDEQIAATRAALEALESERVEAAQHHEFANTILADAQTAEDLRKKLAERDALLNGFDSDPITRERQLHAAKLERPIGEDAGNTRLREFYESVALLNPDSIVDIYKIPPESMKGVITGINLIKHFMESLPIGANFDSLRPLLGVELDKVTDLIGDKKWLEGKDTLGKALEPTEAVDELEARVRERLTELDQFLD